MYCQTNYICDKCNKKIEGNYRTVVELSDERELVGNVMIPIQKELFIFCDKCYDSLFGKILAKKRGYQVNEK